MKLLYDYKLEMSCIYLIVLQLLYLLIKYLFLNWLRFDLHDMKALGEM